MASRRPSPRARLAARLYGSGAAPTKTAAAEAVGLNPSYFSLVSTKNPEVAELIDDVQQQIEDKTVALSAVIQAVSREAVAELRGLMLDSNNEAIRLKAASDILDRNPETSKTQKIATAGFSLGSEDAKALAAALVQSAEAQMHLATVGIDPTKDIVRIPQEPELSDAHRIALPSEVRREYHELAKGPFGKQQPANTVEDLQDSVRAAGDEASVQERPTVEDTEAAFREGLTTSPVILSVVKGDRK